MDKLIITDDCSAAFDSDSLWAAAVVAAWWVVAAFDTVVVVGFECRVVVVDVAVGIDIAGLWCSVDVAAAGVVVVGHGIVGIVG